MSVVAEQGGELYALLVDTVSEVLSLDASLFERNPPTLEKTWAQFSTGIFRLDGRVLVFEANPTMLVHPELEQGPLAVLAVKQLAGLLLSLGLQQAHDTVRLARKNYDNYLCNSQFSSSHNRVCLR